MDYSKMYMEVKFSEKNIKNIKVGQMASITNYTLKEDTLKGKITQISPAVNPETRSFNGYMEIYNPKNILRPGMFVKADITTEEKENIIVIPENVIVNSPRGKIVYIVERKRSVEKLIETGLESDKEIEIKSGLKPNQRLIITGYEMLHNHARVKILK
jgi:RND family efflux transporter MFP subunit